MRSTLPNKGYGLSRDSGSTADCLGPTLVRIADAEPTRLLTDCSEAPQGGPGPYGLVLSGVGTHVVARLNPTRSCTGKGSRTTVAVFPLLRRSLSRTGGARCMRHSEERDLAVAAPHPEEATGREPLTESCPHLPLRKTWHLHP